MMSLLLLLRLMMIKDDHGGDDDGTNRTGLQLQHVEVRFQGVNVEANAYRSSRARPSIFNSYRNAVEVSGRPGMQYSTGACSLL